MENQNNELYICLASGIVVWGGFLCPDGSNVPRDYKRAHIKMAVQGSRRVMQEDLRAVEFETSEDVDVTPTFDNMGLREELLRGIYAYGRSQSLTDSELSTFSRMFCSSPTSCNVTCCHHLDTGGISTFHTISCALSISDCCFHVHY